MCTKYRSHPFSVECRSRLIDCSVDGFRVLKFNTNAGTRFRINTLKKMKKKIQALFFGGHITLSTLKSEHFGGERQPF